MVNTFSDILSDEDIFEKYEPVLQQFQFNDEIVCLSQIDSFLGESLYPSIKDSLDDEDKESFLVTFLAYWLMPKLSSFYCCNILKNNDTILEWILSRRIRSIIDETLYSNRGIAQIAAPILEGEVENNGDINLITFIYNLKLENHVRADDFIIVMNALSGIFANDYVSKYKKDDIVRGDRMRRFNDNLIMNDNTLYSNINNKIFDIK